MPNAKRNKGKRQYIKRSPRQKLIDEAESITFQILQYQRGSLCEICGGKTDQLGLFHILPKGRYQRLRFHKMNLLLACWFNCHYPWHHDYWIARDVIEPKIKELRGDNYENKLRALDLSAPKLTMTYLQVLIKALNIELEELERGWTHGKTN